MTLQELRPLLASRGYRRELAAVTAEEWAGLTHDDRTEILHESMEYYDDCDAWMAECGWQDWMGYYVDENKETLSEEDCNIINEVMRDAWDSRPRDKS